MKDTTRLLKEMGKRYNGLQEIYKNARISLDNNCKCKECFTCVCVSYLNSPKVKTRFTQIGQVANANSGIGHHWFDADTLRFFKSRVLDTVYGSRFFISSEKPPHGNRQYAIRVIFPDGEVENFDNGYGTANAAKREIKRLLEGLKW